MDRYPFKNVSMKQIENAVAAAITGLTGTPTRVALDAMEHISDGAHTLIGQQRYRLGLTVMTDREAEDGWDATPKH